MRSMLIALGLVLSTSAFAATAAPKGNGNFRRAEAITAAGANAKTARVVGLSTAANHVKTGKDFKSARTLLVSDKNKVSIIKAPIDKSEAVTKMSTAQANRMGLKTQAQARKIAAQSPGGVFRGKGALKLTNAGLDETGGSFAFNQKSPSNFVTKSFGEKVKVSNIERTVTVSGAGKSANGSSTIVK